TKRLWYNFKGPIKKQFGNHNITMSIRPTDKIGYIPPLTKKKDIKDMPAKKRPKKDKDKEQKKEPGRIDIEA
ncbi:MAG: hypothetical protein ACUVUQ_02850, partial [Thermodesulfovibrionales bacterium]